MQKFIFTCGDINGIGPEIAIKTLNKLSEDKVNYYYFLCPKNVFQEYTEALEVNFQYSISKTFIENPAKNINIIDIGKAKIDVGKASKTSGKVAFKAIHTSYELLKNKKANAVITAPISKKALKLAGIKFPGHTEMFAKWARVKDYVMTFLSSEMNASLITIHIPLKDVYKHISRKVLYSKMKIILRTLTNDLGIEDPKIALLGLNPHSGEDGILGKEEIKVINPIIKKFNNQNINGPFSPDAFFGSGSYKKYNMIVGMYHDQVLIPFKLLNFHKGVNYTAGLPVIRTSPDHGVAYDIAGKLTANESSFYEAYTYASTISKNRIR